MSTRKCFPLLAATLLLAPFASVTTAKAQGFADFFFPAPFLAPPPFPEPYAAPDPYDEYGGEAYEPGWAPPPNRRPEPQRRARKSQRPLKQATPQPRRARQEALAVPPSLSQSVSCDKAKSIVAEYGFKEIEPELCSGKTRNFRAKRDGKAFAIQITAANGELARVRRLR